MKKRIVWYVFTLLVYLAFYLIISLPMVYLINEVSNLFYLLLLVYVPTSFILFKQCYYRMQLIDDEVWK